MRHSLLLLVLVWTAAPCLAMPEIRHELPTFTMVIPEEFREHPAGRINADVLLSYITGEPGRDSVQVLTVERLHGTLSREALTEASLKSMKLPAGASVSLDAERWREFDVQVIRTRIPTTGPVMISRAVQIPLKPEAIQLTVVTTEGGDAQGKARLTALLSTLGGESNWLTKAERLDRLASGGGRLLIVAGALVAGVIWAVRRARRPE